MTILKTRDDQWANVYPYKRGWQAPSIRGWSGKALNLPAFNTSIIKYLTRDTPCPRGSGRPSVPRSKRRLPKAKIRAQAPSPRPPHVHKTHGLPPPPVTNPTTGRKATGKEGLRPARLITRGPGTSACTRILKWRKGPRCPQASASFPPLPHPRPRLEPPPREPETRGPQFITPAPDLALNRVCPAPSDHTAAFLLGVLGL